MCFSAAASFTAGTIQLAIGAATVTLAHARRDLPFAVFPLLFGVQQMTEGVVWLGLVRDDASVTILATGVYTTFSHVLWPLVVPWAVYLQEPERSRRRVVAGLGAVGVVVAATYAAILWTEGATASIVGNSVAYAVPAPFPWLQGLVYIGVTCGSMLLSTQRWIVGFGAAAFLSAGIAYPFYREAFASVWCFFAAGLALLVYAHFRGKRTRPGHPQAP